MLKKSEARKIVENYNVEKETQIREKAIAYCNNQIDEAIRKRAESGNTNIRISIPTDLNTDIIINYLTTQNGYDVSELTHTYLLIQW